MHGLNPHSSQADRHPSIRELANTRILVIAITGAAVGFLAAFMWFHRSPPPSTPAGGDSTEVSIPTTALSEATKRVLSQLDASVEIRLYSSVKAADGPPGIQEFAENVDTLVRALRDAANGKIVVNRYNPELNPELRAQAVADGIQPHAVSRGNPAYLGLALISGRNRVSMPRLSIEWEGALEYDLARAIERLGSGDTAATDQIDTSQLDASAAQEVAELIPDLASVSVDEGRRILREAALEDFKSVVETMETQLEQARQRILEAQQSQSPTEEQAALEDLRRIQTEQTRRLKELARQVDGQMDALSQLKGVTNRPPAQGPGLSDESPSR